MADRNRSMRSPSRQNGTVVITGNGTGLTYAPKANYNGSDTFTYTLNGGSVATVSITVNQRGRSAGRGERHAQGVWRIAAPRDVPVLTNDTDIDGGPKMIISVTQADTWQRRDHRSVALASSYTPSGGLHRLGLVHVYAERRLHGAGSGDHRSDHRGLRHCGPRPVVRSFRSSVRSPRQREESSPAFGARPLGRERAPVPLPERAALPDPLSPSVRAARPATSFLGAIAR